MASVDIVVYQPPSTMLANPVPKAGSYLTDSHPRNFLNPRTPNIFARVNDMIDFHLEVVKRRRESRLAELRKNMRQPKPTVTSPPPIELPPPIVQTQVVQQKTTLTKTLFHPLPPSHSPRKMLCLGKTKTGEPCHHVGRRIYEGYCVNHQDQAPHYRRHTTSPELLPVEQQKIEYSRLLINGSWV